MKTVLIFEDDLQILSHYIEQANAAGLPFLWTKSVKIALQFIEEDKDKRIGFVLIDPYIDFEIQGSLDLAAALASNHERSDLTRIANSDNELDNQRLIENGCISKGGVPKQNVMSDVIRMAKFIHTTQSPI